VSLGKAGFDWVGSANVEYKKAWPIWTPPPEMIERKPELAQYANGMPPGPKSPLGARALYLFKNGQDTMYRLHGTPEWSSIGKNASSGCVRMLNQDVIDLFSRVSGPTPVHVRHSMYLGADMRGTGRPSSEADHGSDRRRRAGGRGGVVGRFRRASFLVAEMGACIRARSGTIALAAFGYEATLTTCRGAARRGSQGYSGGAWRHEVPARAGRAPPGRSARA
jgi:hypothetical protein